MANRSGMYKILYVINTWDIHYTQATFLFTKQTRYLAFPVLADPTTVELHGAPVVRRPKPCNTSAVVHMPSVLPAHSKTSVSYRKAGEISQLNSGKNPTVDG